MLQSAAWRHRPIPLARILERLEVEHMRHAGTSNGRLYVSYGQFVECSVSRKVIASILSLGERLGLLEVIRPSGKYGGTIRNPHAYRLTYLPSNGKPPSDEWKAISEAEAGALVASYRRPSSAKRRRKN